MCVRVSYQEAAEQVWITLVQVGLHTYRKLIVLLLAAPQWILCPHHKAPCWLLLSYLPLEEICWERSFLTGRTSNCAHHSTCLELLREKVLFLLPQCSELSLPLEAAEQQKIGLKGLLTLPRPLRFKSSLKDSFQVNVGKLVILAVFFGRRPSS